MSPPELTPEQAERLIDALAPVLGLTIAPEFRAGVVFNLQVAFRLARLCEADGFADHDEAAPVFEA